MNKKQRAAAVQTLTEKIAVMAAIEATYEAAFSSYSPVPEAVYDAWNAAVSAKSALEFERRYVSNYSPVPAGQEAIYEMIRENRD
jgi:hypothetical protein